MGGFKKSASIFAARGGKLDKIWIFFLTGSPEGWKWQEIILRTGANNFRQDNQIDGIYRILFYFFDAG